MAEEARVYGMADQANRHPPAAQGMRGENSPERLDGYEHGVTLGDGRKVMVEEASGVAFAEATGRAGRSADGELEIEFAPEERQNIRRVDVPVSTILAAVGVAVGLFLVARARRRPAAGVDTHNNDGLVPVTDVAHRQTEPARQRPF